MSPSADRPADPTPVIVDDITTTICPRCGQISLEVRDIINLAVGTEPVATVEGCPGCQTGTYHPPTSD